MTFAELPLSPALQRAIAEEKYVTPTPIQAAAIPHILDGRDLLRPGVDQNAGNIHG